MKKSKQIAIIAVISVLGIGMFMTLIGAVIASNIKNPSSSDNSNTSYQDSNSSFGSTDNSNQSFPTSVSSSSSTNYKDGSYSSDVSYTAHRIPEEIKVNLTLKGNIISSVTNQYSTNDRESRQYQNAFDQSFKKYVIGKNINSVSLNRVAGASDTTDAFMEALQKIQSEAQS